MTAHGAEDALERLARNRRIDAVVLLAGSEAGEAARLIAEEDPGAPPIFASGAREIASGARRLAAASEELCSKSSSGSSRRNRDRSNRAAHAAQGSRRPKRKRAANAARSARRFSCARALLHEPRNGGPTES